MTKTIVFALSAVAASLYAADLPLSKDTSGCWTFGDGRLQVTFDRETGWPAAFAVDGETVLRGDPAFRTPIAMDCNGPLGAAGRKDVPRGVKVERVSDDTVCSHLELADWRFRVFQQLLPEKRMARRWLEFEWTGTEPRKFVNIWMLGGKVACKDGRGGYFLPCRFPPRRYGRADFKVGQSRTAYDSASPVTAEDGEGRNCLHCLDELQPYSDRGCSFVTDRADGFTFSVRFASYGRAKPGKPQKVGDQWLVFGRGTDEDALLAMHEWHRTVGHLPPADRPYERMRKQVVYSTHPVGKSEFNNADRGGFKFAQTYLPFAQALGVKTLWVRPVTWPGQYSPDDLYRTMENVGTDEDHLAYVRDAHSKGMEVWSDAVPHGGRLANSERSKAHPEWVCLREDGTPYDAYWAYDFNAPGWVKYFSEWVEWYTRKFELDGWRMDVPTGARFPNWNPDAPHDRASYAQLQGGISQHKGIRSGARRANPNAVTMGEENGSNWSCLADAIYDQLLCHVHFHDFRERDAASVVRDLRRWLHEQKFSFVPGTNWMRYPESHDSRLAENVWGRACATALMAMCSWIDGFPLVYQEGEDGAFEAYRRIFAIRAAVPELTLGDADYLSAKAPDGVFVCLRSCKEGRSAVVINFNAERVRGTVTPGSDAAFEIDLPPFGYEVRRLAGPSVADLLGPEPKPYVPAVTGPKAVAAAAGGVRLPGGAVAELRDLTNGIVTAAYRIVTEKTADGIRLRVADFGGVRPDTVRLTVKFAGTERWFAHAAQGSFESPYFVRHPDIGRIRCGSRGNGGRLIDGEVRWSNALHPFGFARAHAEVGSVSGDRAVAVHGFAEGARVELRDRLDAEIGMAATVGGSDASAFTCEISETSAKDALAFREIGTDDPRLKVVSGGWLYDDGSLRVRFYNSGAIAGVWTRTKDGSWRREIASGGWRGTKTAKHTPTLGWRLRDEEVAEQAYDVYGTTVFRHRDDGSLVLEFSDVRAALFGKHYLLPEVEEAVTYVFGRGEFSADTSFALVGKCFDAKDGEWEYRMVADPAVRGKFVDVEYEGVPPARVEEKDGMRRWIYHDSKTEDCSPPAHWRNSIRWTYRTNGEEADYLVIDCSRPYAKRRYAKAEDLPYGGLTNRIYAKEKLVMRRVRGGDAGDFWIGVYPLTQGQCVRLTGQPSPASRTLPERGDGSRTGWGDPEERPVESVSWNDLNAAWGILPAIRNRTGHAFALPSEAQWLLACRAGTTTPWNDGVHEKGGAWIEEWGWVGYGGAKAYPNGLPHWGATHPVGLKRPNAWGLYDCHGNVWEWCADWSDAGRTNKVLRGGGFANGCEHVSNRFRHSRKPSSRGGDIGVRLILPPESP